MTTQMQNIGKTPINQRYTHSVSCVHTDHYGLFLFLQLSSLVLPVFLQLLHNVNIMPLLNMEVWRQKTLTIYCDILQGRLYGFAK